MLASRLIKFFYEQAKKDPVKYHAFYEDYGLFFREGIVTSPEQETRVGKVTVISEQCKRNLNYSIFKTMFILKDDTLICLRC